MDRVSKFYPASGVQANDEARLEVRDGEIHALVGENGAGKSTLVRVLCGLERADSGCIELGGRAVEIPSPAAARALGIGMVHQHFTTVGGFTVAENLALGDEPTRAGLFYDGKRAIREARRSAAECGFDLDPEAPASSLTVGQRQQLEILKALRGEARLLVLDEPTAALAEQEIRSLFKTLRDLRARGRTIVLITHKVREVKDISDAVTVMRAGRTVARVETASTGEAELSSLMVGGSGGRAFTRGPRVFRGAAVFEMRGVSLGRRHGGAPVLDRLGLRVEAGEILGLCGVAGNGLSEVEDLAAGILRPSSGEVLFGGRPVPRHRRPGLGYVPADRMRRGACLEATLAENLAALDRRRFFPRGLADGPAMRDFARGAIERFSIKASPGDQIESLSGGNIQKSILARELSGRSAFLVASNPTWGLDAAATEEIYARLEAARDDGAAILLLSYSLDDILVLSDRIGALCKGRLVCDLANRAGLGRELLGEYMLGLRDDFADRREGSLP
jgi:ABC-type uncharacterized transport system ATPase subunit